MSVKVYMDRLREGMEAMMADANFQEMGEWCLENGMPPDVDGSVNTALGALASYYTNRGCPPLTLAVFIASIMQAAKEGIDGASSGH